MALVNVPVVNSTLINAQLLEKKKQFIINDCEMLRREFEVYGIELSDVVLDMYRKSLIIANANVVWDMRAVSIRQPFNQSYTNNTYKFAFQTPVTHQLAAGVKSIDPITLSFMTFDEAKKLIEDHIKGVWANPSPVNYNTQKEANYYEIGAKYVNPFCLSGYAQIEANWQTLFGAFNNNYIANGTAVPTSNAMYLDNYISIVLDVQYRAASIPKMFQNPTLESKSLIPEFKKMFATNPFMTNGIVYKPIFNYETIHYAAIEGYFTPFKKPASTSIQYTTSWNMNLAGLTGYEGTWHPSISMPKPIVVGTYTIDEITNLYNSYKYPATDTRSDYQKAFTYSSYTPDSVSTALNADPVAQRARIVQMNKAFFESKGGNLSILVNLFRIIAEAHASVMTPINIHTKDFYKSFRKSLAICKQMYVYPDGSVGTTSSRSVYLSTGGSRTEYGTLTNAVQQLYVFLNDNFKIRTWTYGKTYTAAQAGDVVSNDWQGMKEIVLTNSSSGIYNCAVDIPVDASQPFPYYMIDINTTGAKTHLVKSSALLGIQKLRNGFLYQDITKNFEPTFVNFNEDAILQLEALASKQIAVYDLLDDVKNGVIYTKAITQSVEKQPFNPMMPEYTTTTTYIDVMKTVEGDLPIIHPDMEYEIKWSQLHAEMIIQSSFYYYRYAIAMQPTVDEYNNRVGSYIITLLNEMKSLSTTYVQAEADKLRAEQEQTKLEVTLEKLKNGVFIDDNGREYWRPLLPEEKIEMDKMIKRVQDNIAAEENNKTVVSQNLLYQTEVDKKQILENDQIQMQADMRVIELNQQYQQQANQQVLEANEAAQKEADIKQALLNQRIAAEDKQWRIDNVDSIQAPTWDELNKIAKDNNTILSDALILWENAHPFYSHNKDLVIVIDVLRKSIVEAELTAAERLVQAKVIQAKMTAALMELFPDKF